MDIQKKKLKRKLCLQHRQERYDHAIDKLIKGEVDPEYVSKRWKKLKQVRGK